MVSVALPPIPHQLVEFRHRLREHFGNRLEQLILFGSYARGEAGPDSDLDVAVILDRINSHSERTWPMALSGELTGPPTVTPIVLSLQELQLLNDTEDALASSLSRDGIHLV